MHGKIEIIDLMQTASSILLELQWCVLCKGASKSLNHLLWSCSFASMLWDVFMEFFSVSLAHKDSID